MNDLSNVKEINVVHDMTYANKHLANGWILIAVNSVSATDNTGKSIVSTEYVLGWENALPSKHVSQDEDKVASKYSPQYDDYGVEQKRVKPRPQAKAKPKKITIID